MDGAASDPIQTLGDTHQSLAARKSAAELLSAQGTETALAALIYAAEATNLPPELARHVGACIARAGATTFSEWDLRDWSADAYLGWDEASAAKEPKNR
jgi:hypothetical protein